MPRYKLKYGKTLDEEREAIRPLLLRYFEENGKLDERGIKVCDYLPTFYALRNIIICDESHKPPKYDVKPLYEFIGKSINEEYYNTYFNRTEIEDDKEFKRLKCYIEIFIAFNEKLPIFKEIIEQNIRAYTLSKKKTLIEFYISLGYKELVNKSTLKIKNTKEKSDEQILSDFKRVINTYGQISCKEFSRYDLASYSTYKARFNVKSYYDLLKLIGIEPIIINECHLHGYEIADIKNSVLANYYKYKKELGHIPTLQEITTYSKILNLPYLCNYFTLYWNGYTEFLIDIGDYKKSKSRIFISKDNVKCFSRYELLFVNYFYDNNIEYEKEIWYKKVIPNFERDWRFDFYLPQHDIYVEFFGITGNDKYNKRVIEKQNVCVENNINLLSLFPQDIIDNNFDMASVFYSKVNNENINHEYRKSN